MFSEHFQVDGGGTLRRFDLRLQRRRTPAEVCVCARLVEYEFTDAAKLLLNLLIHARTSTSPVFQSVNELLYLFTRQLKTRLKVLSDRKPSQPPPMSV